MKANRAQNRTRNAIYCFFLVVGIVVASLPRNGMAQPINPSTIGQTPTFEGTITFSFKVSGRLAESIRMRNPINTMTWHIRNGDYIIHLYGSQRPSDPFLETFPTTRLFIADSNQVYVVDANNRRAFKGDKYDKPDSIPPVASFTGDSMQVLGEWCYAYQVAKQKEKIIYYVTPKYRVELGYFENRTNATANFLTKGLYGCIPLLTIRENPDRVIELRAVAAKEEQFSQEMFRLPASFELLPMPDYRRP